VPYKLAIGKTNGLLRKIIHYYGPATWAKDGSWGYCTPIHMLTRITRLQVVVEIIINETARALNLLAKQSTKMRNAICWPYTICWLLREEFVENLT
jgi:hypothetical protein